MTIPTPTIFQNIANSFRQAMTAQGVTQVQLVQKTGLTPRTVNLLLSGKHNFKVSSLNAIAEVLGLQVTISRRPRAGSKSARPDAPGAQATPLLFYAPGARVVELQIRNMGGTLTPAQAQVLWVEVQEVLLKAGNSSTVGEALASAAGGLDTAAREAVRDALDRLLVGRPRPANLDGRNAFDAYLLDLSAALSARGACAVAAPSVGYAEFVAQG